MIEIVKGREPREWIQYRNTPNVDFEAIPELRDALYREQGQRWSIQGILRCRDMVFGEGEEEIGIIE